MRRVFFRPEEFAMNFCKMRLGWGCVCVCQRPFTVTALLVMGALNVPEKIYQFSSPINMYALNAD